MSWRRLIRLYLQAYAPYVTYHYIGARQNCSFHSRCHVNVGELPYVSFAETSYSEYGGLAVPSCRMKCSGFNTAIGSGEMTLLM